jgi:orotate phosphoribosyltransferase
MDWKEELLKIYVDRGGILKGDFTLTSGKKSNLYIDSRLVSTYPRSLEIIAERFAGWLEEELAENPDMNLIGPSLSGIPIAAVLAVKLKKPYLIDRGKPKTHGTAKRFEGTFTDSPKCVIIDDLVTRGTTSVELVDELRSMGKEVDRVFAVVDRNEGGAELLAEKGVKLQALLSKAELLDAFDRYKGP